ncbi:MAG: hypothetical protein K0R69_3385 [Clostridia bacterium]|jgi:hypothetical protein|nr:hypothetical protein [Clostridia bacterium]
MVEFLAENWFAIVAVVLIVFFGVKGNKILGGNVRGGGCCGGGSLVSENHSDKSKEPNKE